MTQHPAMLTARRWGETAVERTLTVADRLSAPARTLADAVRGRGVLTGSEHLPETGPALVVGNHRHRWDAWALSAHLPRPAVHIGMADLAEDHRRIRAGGGAGRHWRAALDTIASDGVLLLLPEGVPSPDQRLHRGREVMGWLLLELAPAPVVPALIDTRAAQFSLGPSRNLSRQRGLSAAAPLRRVVARGLADEVIHAIAVHGDLSYVDSYTTTARADVRALARQRRQDRQRMAKERRLRELQALEQRLLEAEEERRDLARRHAEAAAEAREHAVEAARRDQDRTQAPSP